MIGTYIKTACRNIITRRLYSAISIGGLALGIAVAAMIGLFLRAELGFDKMHEAHDRTYRYNWVNVGTGARFATFFNGVSPLLADAMPGDIELNARLGFGDHLLEIGDKRQFESISFVDPTFFDMFDYGPAARIAMEDTTNMVLTEAAAMHLFGRPDPVGETITLEEQFDFRVAAVLPNNPSNSHHVANIFISMKNIPAMWGRPNFEEPSFSDVVYHYVRLKPGVDAAAVEDRVMDHMVRNVDERVGQFADVILQPLTNIHFNTELQNEMPLRDTVTGQVKAQRQPTDVYIFGSIAILTLVIAAFNFMNLQVIQISNRLGEVGVRKALGASRRDILVQFLVETSVLAFIGLFVAVVIAEAALPMFGSLVGTGLRSGMVIDPSVLSVLFLVGALMALAAGAYPALTAARAMPVKAMAGQTVKGMGPAKLRAGLVVLQFSIAIGLITASGVVNSQIEFTFAKPLGFNPDGVVLVDLPNRDARQAYGAMRSALEQNPAIERVSKSFVVPTQDLSNGWQFNIEGGDPEFDLLTRSVDHDAGAFEVLGLEFVAGRGFSEDRPADKRVWPTAENARTSAGVVLNETAARNAGYATPQEAIGKRLFRAYKWRGTDMRMDYEIIGVVKDAHYRSLRSEISPLSYFWSNDARSMILRMVPGREAEALAAIDQVWADALPGLPNRRSLLAEEYRALYAGENRTFALFIGFAGIAVLIACIGLYGLTAYMVDRRQKEIGIRKVLGATVTNIVALLSWNYVRLVVVANLIAWPAVWWVMTDWLESFAYRTDLHLSVFLLASIAALALAGMTTSVRTLSAARANPALALRRE